MNDGKLTGRAKRMQHIKDLNKGAGLNLVSLMDIFTILVFFLLVNSGTENLPNRKDLALPTSVAERVPEEILTMAITRDEILLHGKKIADIDSVIGKEETVIASLKAGLVAEAKNMRLNRPQVSAGRAIMILGDENISYALLRKVLETCRRANYTRISFAAIREVKGEA